MMRVKWCLHLNSMLNKTAGCHWASISGYHFLTSPHLSSPHLTSPHLSLSSPSPHHLLTWHLSLSSPLLSSPHPSSPLLTSPHLILLPHLTLPNCTLSQGRISLTSSIALAPEMSPLHVNPSGEVLVEVRSFGRIRKFSNPSTRITVWPRSHFWAIGT